MRRLVSLAVWGLMAMLTAPAVADPQLYLATAPIVRSQIPGEARTAFVSIVNAGDETAETCRLVFRDDGATNALQNHYQHVDLNQSPPLLSGIDAAFDIPAGSTATVLISQNFLINFFFGPEGFPVSLNVACDNAAAQSIAGFSALSLVQFETDPPDIIAAIATPSSDGVLRINQSGGAARAAVAFVDAGYEGTPRTITIRPDFQLLAATSTQRGIVLPDIGAPYELLVCATNPATGQCLEPMASELTLEVADQPLTLALALRDTDRIGTRLIPDLSRIRIAFFDQNGYLAGAATTAFAVPPRETSASAMTGENASLANIAGIYRVSLLTDDGLISNGQLDRSDGYLVINPDGFAHLYTSFASHSVESRRNSADATRSEISSGNLELIETAGTEIRFSGNLSGTVFQGLRDAPGAGPYELNVTLTGHADHRGSLVATWTRSETGPAATNIPDWPVTGRLRASHDAMGFLPTTTESLAGEYGNIRDLIQDEFRFARYQLTADGRLTRTSSDERNESCAVDFRIINGPAGMNVHSFSGSQTGCDASGEFSGLAFSTGVREYEYRISGETLIYRYEQLEMLGRNAETGENFRFAARRLVSGPQ